MRQYHRNHTFFSRKLIHDTSNTQFFSRKLIRDISNTRFFSIDRLAGFVVTNDIFTEYPFARVWVFTESLQVGAFNIYDSSVVSFNATDFDYNSISIMDPLNFSKNGLPVISSRNGQPIFNAGRLSFRDCQAISALYNCAIRCPTCKMTLMCVKPFTFLATVFLQFTETSQFSEIRYRQDAPENFHSILQSERWGKCQLHCLFLDTEVL